MVLSSLSLLSIVLVLMVALTTVINAAALLTVIGLSAAETAVYAHEGQGPRSFDSKHAKGGVDAPPEGMQNSLHRLGHSFPSAVDLQIGTKHALALPLAARELDVPGSRADIFSTHDMEKGNADVSKSSCRLSYCFSNALDILGDTKHDINRQCWGRESVQPDDGLRPVLTSSRVGVALAAPHGMGQKSFVRHPQPVATAADMLDDTKR